jgi:hypothetical protein
MEQMFDRRTLLQRSVAIGLMGISVGSRAQSDLAKFQIGFAAGGITDVLCRRLEPILKEDKYASVVILEHRPGASGRIALEAVRNAPPNGLSLLPMPASVMTVLPHAIVGPSYHPTRDFAPVGALGEGVIYLAINAERVPARTLQAYVEVFQKDPSKALYATGGIGSMPHLIGTLIEQELKVKFEHVPYKGGAAAFTDAVGGQVPAIMGTLQPQVIDAHRARKLVIDPPRRPDLHRGGHPLGALHRVHRSVDNAGHAAGDAGQAGGRAGRHGARHQVPVRLGTEPHAALSQRLCGKGRQRLRRHAPACQADRSAHRPLARSTPPLLSLETRT